MVDKLVPAICSMWPNEDTEGIIYVQQDNTKPHLNIGDIEFTEATRKYGYDIRLHFQPPNSPELNVLDLSFFQSDSKFTTRGITYYY